MNWLSWLYALRIVVATAGLVLMGRLLSTALAYLSWRAFAYFFIAVVSYAAIGYYRFFPFGAPDNPTLRAFLETTFVVGLAGCLWERVLADRRRRHDAWRLMEKWRTATNLAQKRARELEVLAAVTSGLTATLDLRKVLQAVADRALGLGEADAVIVFVRDRDTGELNHYGVSAAVSQRLLNLPSPRLDGLTAQVAQTGEAAFISQVRQHPSYQDGSYPDLVSMASLPLRLEAEVVGVLNVGYTHSHEFDDDEIHLLHALADAAALAVRNAALHDHITNLAVTDELTGLPNRRRFLECLRAETQRARRYGRPLTLMMVDLDRLKQINDQYGHAAGDAMLRGLAHSLSASVRGTDVPARLGGDEFAVLLPETPRDAALIIAERIRASVAKFRAEVDGALISSTVSIGLAGGDAGDLPDVPSFMHLADDALYKSKTAGRNTVTPTDITPPGQD